MRYSLYKFLYSENISPKNSQACSAKNDLDTARCNIFLRNTQTNYGCQIS